FNDWKQIKVTVAVTCSHRAIGIQFYFEINEAVGISERRARTSRACKWYALPTEDDSIRRRLDDVNIGIGPEALTEIQIIPHAGNHLELRKVSDGAGHVIRITVSSFRRRRKIKVAIRRDRHGVKVLTEKRKRKRQRVILL